MCFFSGTMPMSGGRIVRLHDLPARPSFLRILLLVVLILGLAGNRTTVVAQGIDFGSLENVADFIQITYQGNQFHPFTGVLTSYARVRNVSTDQDIEGPLLLIIDSFSVPGITALNADGTTPEGRPYYDFSSLVGADAILTPDELSEPKQLRFRNPARRPFSFEASCIAVIPLGLAPDPPVLDSFTTMTNAPSVTISGSARVDSTVEISGPASTFTVSTDAGRFTAEVPLAINQLNQLYFTTITSEGARSAPASARITQDSRPPSLFIDFPANGSEITTEDVDVGGRVSDILSGFMGLSVSVNGAPAEVDIGIGTNGTFLRAAVPLAVGSNEINATATDQLGNSVTKQVTITRVEIPVGAPRMTIASGNRQSGQVHLPLNNPIVVRVLRGDGSPFANKLVTFKVTRSDGRLAAAPFGDGEMMLQVRADENGLAKAYWRLGADAGCGNNRIAVTSTDIAGTVLFCASATPGPPIQINVGSGNNQRVEAGAHAPEPLRVWVSDTCNGVANVPVEFVVRRGGGKVDGEDQVTVTTSDTGHAEAALTLSDEPGHNEIEATFPGNPGMGAFFIAYGIGRDPEMSTSFSGLVFDNANRPIDGAQITLVSGSTGYFASTNEQGQFMFDDLAEGGPADLLVDGLVATAVGGEPVPPGSFPSLHFEPVLIPNSANSIPMPILLPPLNPNNARVYDGTQDVELTVEGVEGLSMLVKAGSMRRRDGSIPTPANPAILALNQVHHDDIPMPMPDGAAPPFAWTLQPAGATFDPPIQITYPNMSGLPAGSIAYFLSFDHDTMRFEIVATGSVTDDGQSIVSDTGSGLTLAGWGCNCPPYSVTGDCCKCEDCEECNCGQCVSECSEDCKICTGDSCESVVVTIEAADITTNTIGVALSPEGVSGKLELFLDSHLISTHTNVPGGSSQSIASAFGNIDNLPNNTEFQRVRAIWTVNGKSCAGERSYRIKVLDLYRHSQYNVPSQSDMTCQGGSPKTVYMARLQGNTCTFQQATLPGIFESQVRINGTGRSTEFGLIKPETATNEACLQSPNRPPGISDSQIFRSHLPNVTGACGTVSNSTVAAHRNHPDLSCGDTVYINTVALKTVRDRCPACGPPTRADFKQLDNFNNDDGRCTNINDLGNFKTIKVFND